MEKQFLILSINYKIVVNSSLILDEIYEGQVIGENSRSDDMSVNVTKAKKQSNVRSSGNDEKREIPPIIFSLEEALEYIQR
jgi:GTP-binding protein